MELISKATLYVGWLPHILISLQYHHPYPYLAHITFNICHLCITWDILWDLFIFYSLFIIVTNKKNRLFATKIETYLYLFCIFTIVCSVVYMENI